MDPIPQSSSVLGIGIILWLIFFDTIFSYILKYHIDIFTHGIIAVAIGLISTGLIHSHYLDIERTNTIYQKYKSALPREKIKRGTVLTFTVIVLPFILTIFWAIIQSKN